MVTIKEYAESKKISYEAVRKQIRRYTTELDGHIQRINRTQFLDEYAVMFLDEKRNGSPIVIVESSKDEEIEFLKSELEKRDSEIRELLVRLTTVQEELIKNTQELSAARIELMEQKLLAAETPERADQPWWKFWKK